MVELHSEVGRAAPLACGRDYAEVREYGRDQVFTSPALGGREVRVVELLGRTPVGVEG